jgi:hypothetical protein
MAEEELINPLIGEFSEKKESGVDIDSDDDESADEYDDEIICTLGSIDDEDYVNSGCVSITVNSGSFTTGGNEWASYMEELKKRAKEHTIDAQYVCNIKVKCLPYNTLLIMGDVLVLA